MTATLFCMYAIILRNLLIYLVKGLESVHYFFRKLLANVTIFNCIILQFNLKEMVYFQSPKQPEQIDLNPILL